MKSQFQDRAYLFQTEHVERKRTGQAGKKQAKNSLHIFIFLKADATSIQHRYIYLWILTHVLYITTDCFNCVLDSDSLAIIILFVYLISSDFHFGVVCIRSDQSDR